MEAELIPRACPSCERVMPGTPLAQKLEVGEAFNFIGRDQAYRSPFRWLRCPECFLDYVCLAPSNEWWIKAYQASGETAAALDDRASLTAKKLWRDQIHPSEGEKLAVVDVGSGRGHFLSALKAEGHKVLGLEPNPALRKSSPLAPNELQDPSAFYSSTSEEKFDVISLQLSFEHLQEPMKDLKVLKARLKPGGRVFVMYHDGNGIPHELLGEKSPLWDIQHLQLLNPDAAETFFRRLGMKVVSDRSYWNSYPLSYWGRLLGLSLKDDSALGKINLPIPAGNRVMVAKLD